MITARAGRVRGRPALPILDWFGCAWMSVSLWGKLGGAGLGFALGGPLGALLGTVAGHVLVDREGAPFGPSPPDLVFATGLIALSAKMAKSDGVVAPSEVAAFERVVEVPAEDRPRVRALFDLAKGSTAGFEAYATQMAGLLRDRPALLEDVLDGLFQIAGADGAVHERELDYLARVSELFGFTGDAFDRIAARHVRLPDDPYAVLGAGRDMDDAALRALYRRLVAEHHPDRAIARGLPPEAVRIADGRLAAINAAWERIAAERGIR